MIRDRGRLDPGNAGAAWWRWPIWFAAVTLTDEKGASLPLCSSMDHGETLTRGNQPSFLPNRRRKHLTRDLDRADDPAEFAVGGAMSGSFVSRNKEFFEKKNQLRVVISGHGMRLAGEPQIALPLGMTLYFYCLDGRFTSDELGRAIEGFTGTGQIPKPVETVRSGEPVWNYRLTWGSDLTINATKLQAKYDLITIDDRDQNRAIPLSILLRDTRCQNAEIHWAACRELKPATSSMHAIGKFDTLKTLTDLGKNMSDLKSPPIFNP
jgi:hypothetical protein